MAVNSKEKHNKLIHTSFEIGLALKGINGFLEIIGGLLILYLSPDRLSRFINFITQGELLEDPKDILANILLRFSSRFSLSAQGFFFFYLMSHGIIKCIIIFLLWRKKLWAYPLSIGVFSLFIIYQIYKYLVSPSIWMILLSILDIILIILTYFEYQSIKRHHMPHDSSSSV